MEITFQDDKNWISKRQRDKIRSLFENKATSEKQILNSIEYRVGEGPYLSCKIEKNDSLIHLIFSEIDQRAILKEKLKGKLRHFKGKRSHNILASWDKYYDIVDKCKGVAPIPSPPEIIKNKDQYQMVQNLDKTGWLKEYVELCLLDEAKLT